MNREIKTINEAIQVAGQIILDAKPRGVHLSDIEQQMEDGSSLMVCWKRGWAIGCDLSLNFGHADCIAKYDGESYQLRNARITISWSGTGRDVSTAAASVALYSEVIALAAEIDSVLNEDLYGSKI